MNCRAKRAIAPPQTLTIPLPNTNCRAKKAIASPVNSKLAPLNTNCRAKKAMFDENLLVLVASMLKGAIAASSIKIVL
jgi:hypothetical protein